MYIEQLKKYNLNLALYFIIPIGFMLLMLWNYFASLDLDTNQVIQQTISMIGVNGTFIAMIAPLAIGLFVVFFWTKFIQNLDIRILTTSRNKVDWKRIFFSFFLWAAITSIMILVAYYSTPEKFILNFKPEKFFVFLVLG